MPTGLAIRQRMIRNSRGALGFLGTSTAVAGGTDRLRDARRFDMNTLSMEDISGAFIRITQCFTGTATASSSTSITDGTAPFPGSSGLTGALVAAFTANGSTTVLTITSDTTSVLTGTAGWSNGTPSSTSTYYVTYGHIAKVIDLDTTTGDIYFDPAVTTAVTTNTQYELWYYHRPDYADESRDLALTTKNSMWRMKPLSVLAEVADWTTSGASNAAAVPTTLAFPQELFDRSMLVTNSGADGYIPSESYYVQPNQTMMIYGWVSTRAQTAAVRLRRITSTAADITLSGTSTFTLRGWQAFYLTAVIPSGCEEVQLWLGGASASCISEWAGVGMMVVGKNQYSHEARVLSKHDIGTYYEYVLPYGSSGSTQQVRRSPNHAVRREQAGDGVVAIFDAAPTSPVYYQERHRFSALQSDYMTLVHRATGDATSTDCNVDYAAWAATVELLEPRKRNDETDRLLKIAYKNTRHWERRVGPDPTMTPEHKTQGGIPILSL